MLSGNQGSFPDAQLQVAKHQRRQPDGVVGGRTVGCGYFLPLVFPPVQILSFDYFIITKHPGNTVTM